ncbi:hypothetical protein [Sphingomonas sp.]|uniref:hypothetical protein n=1 Tax=Sphingomonas sp. TaxID=28214 RepID=UPI003CC63B9C
MLPDLQPYIAAMRPHLDAVELRTLFGASALDVAAARADRARAVGNHVHFCRWREVGRLLAVLAMEGSAGTVH